jgi:CelD/BcsL family acetyltransferase involved in cellulose biosynthesis
MNFYASDEYLRVVADVYFPGKRTTVEDVRIGDDVLRVLVVEGKRPVTSLLFLDYHEPIRDIGRSTRLRRFGYAESVTRRIIDIADLSPDSHPGFEPAPFIDWSKFATFADYEAFVISRQRGLVRERERRGRRLAEHCGPIVFTMDDTRDDVLPFAQRWKGMQLRATGYRDYFADPKTFAYLDSLRARGLLTVSTLRGNDRLLSVWIGFIHDRVWSGWVFTYDPELKKYSVGHQLVHAMVKKSHELGHREFDFSTGAEDYKMMYATHARLLASVGAPPLRARLVARAKREAKERAPNLFEAVRRWKRVLVTGWGERVAKRRAKEVGDG